VDFCSHTLNTIPHQIAAASSPAAQANSEAHWLPVIAIVVSACSLIVSLSSLMMALRNTWFSSREANKKAVFSFLEYLRKAQDLAFDNYGGLEIKDKKQKYFHLLGAHDIVRLEMIGRTEDIEKIMSDLYSKYSRIVQAGVSEEKMEPDEQIKLAEEIRGELFRLIRNYTLWNYVKFIVLRFRSH